MLQKVKFSKLTNIQERGLQGENDQKSLFEKAKEEIDRIESYLKSKEDHLKQLDEKKKELEKQISQLSEEENIIFREILPNKIKSLHKSKVEEFDKLEAEVQNVINGWDKNRQQIDSVYGLVGRNLGKHPVIFLTLGNVTGISSGETKCKNDPNA